MNGSDQRTSSEQQPHPFRSDPRVSLDRVPAVRVERTVAHIVWRVTPWRARMMAATGLGWAGTMVVLQDHPWALALLATMAAMVLGSWVCFRARLERP